MWHGMWAKFMLDKFGGVLVNPFSIAGKGRPGQSLLGTAFGWLVHLKQDMEKRKCCCHSLQRQNIIVYSCCSDLNIWTGMEAFRGGVSEEKVSFLLYLSGFPHQGSFLCYLSVQVSGFGFWLLLAKQLWELMEQGKDSPVSATTAINKGLCDLESCK